MQLGVGLPSFSSKSHILPPNRFQSIAETIEQYGFAGAWVIEHLLKPPTYATSLLDPLTTLSYVAGATESLPIGTSVLLLPLRNPVLLAKRAVTIQHLSSRRLTLGLGTGYVDAEFDAVNIPISERSGRFREGIELLTRLFSEESVTFDGEYFTITDVRLEPAHGHPPRVLSAGSGEEQNGTRTMPETVKQRFQYADGWIAPPRLPDNLEEDLSLITSYQDAPEASDRVALQYLHFVPSNDTSLVEQRQRNAVAQLLGEDRSPEYAITNWLTGTPERILSILERYEALGFDEVILHPVVRDPNKITRQLQLWSDELLPHFP